MRPLPAATPGITVLIGRSWRRRGVGWTARLIGARAATARAVRAEAG
ncbi:hypothetical protein O7542_05675 [Micromonospora sp. WMMC264]|nr:hypothetical protein [Micromonospora sp. WMMC264]WBB86627.1 hypothetical protein O7542_05675 [Micromonospora sp. WMMC264]